MNQPFYRTYPLQTDPLATVDAIISHLPDELSLELVLAPVEESIGHWVLRAEAFTQRAADLLAESVHAVLRNAPSAP